MSSGRSSVKWIMACKKHIQTSTHQSMMKNNVAEQFLMIERKLSQDLAAIDITDPVTTVYNPLQYAEETHSYFTKKYCQGKKKILFLGMNPGPFGMAQNGVPFGETSIVKEWLCVKGKVGSPTKEHPKRPIDGLDCSRSEVSGSRFWGLFKDICFTPNIFFEHCYVYNYCPLVLMSKTGKNVTPDKLPLSQRTDVMKVCDEALRDIVTLLEVGMIVGVGKYAEKRAKEALYHVTSPRKRRINEESKAQMPRKKQSGSTSTILPNTHDDTNIQKPSTSKNNNPVDVKACVQEFGDVQIVSILHPSPINPKANKGWADIARAELEELDIMKYFE